MKLQILHNAAKGKLRLLLEEQMERVETRMLTERNQRKEMAPRTANQSRIQLLDFAKFRINRIQLTGSSSKLQLQWVRWILNTPITQTWKRLHTSVERTITYGPELISRSRIAFASHHGWLPKFLRACRLLGRNNQAAIVRC